MSIHGIKVKCENKTGNRWKTGEKVNIGKRGEKVARVSSVV